MRTGRTLKRRAPPGGRSRRRTVLAVYAVWVTFVLLASVPYLAETGSRRPTSHDTFEYRPTFTADGEIEHYTVERANATVDGTLVIKYDAGERSVDIAATNVEKLTVDCDSILQKHSMEIAGVEYDDDLIEEYFNELGSIKVRTDVRDSEGLEITWKHMPVPSAVVADRESYEEGWPGDGDDITVDVPPGRHSYILYFGETPEFPRAVIIADHTVILPGLPVSFDARSSSGGEGADGKIIDYMWDFNTGDGTMLDSGEKQPTHTYGQVGTYNVSLTVRNGYQLKHTTYIDIEVVSGDVRVDIDDDGLPNWDDPDMDGDGYSNEDELRLLTDPADPLSSPPDMDDDRIPDADDPDIDGDGVLNNDDAYPNDATRYILPEESGGEEEDDATLLMLVVVVILIVVIMVIAGAISSSRRRAAEERMLQEMQAKPRAPSYLATPGDMRSVGEILPELSPETAAALAAAGEGDEAPGSVSPLGELLVDPDEADMDIDDIDISDIWGDDDAVGAEAPAGSDDQVVEDISSEIFDDGGQAGRPGRARRAAPRRRRRQPGRRRR